MSPGREAATKPAVSSPIWEPVAIEMLEPTFSIPKGLKPGSPWTREKIALCARQAVERVEIIG
jgi:hypothetical protein